MKQIMLSMLSLFVISALMFGCAESSEDEENMVEPVSFVTYNAGLATGYVDYAPERLPLIASALAGLNADVLCLEEVWSPEQIQAIVNSTENSFPHNFYEMTTGKRKEGESSCTEEEVQPLQVCIGEYCAEEDPANIANCALEFCSDEFNSLSADCTSCIVANLGKEIDEIFSICVEGIGSIYTYDGHNGLLLLSKFPLSNKEHSILDSYLTRRVVLHAAIQTEAVGTVDLFCTHLTADLSEEVSYGGTYESWATEQSAQIDTLLNYIDQKSGVDSPVVLMGDMNCGLESANVSAKHPTNFQKFIDADMTAPYVEESGSPCTWCMENPMTGSVNDNIIDHILTGNIPTDMGYESSRILDHEVTFTSGEEEVTARLSDHYGVKVTISFHGE